MSEKPYDFLTKEEIAYALAAIRSQGLEGSAEFFERVVKERDAFREVAINDAYDPWSHGEKLFERGPAECEVDAEARRLLSQQPTPSNGGRE